MNDAVIWHDVENGGYEVDLPLWHRLAQRAGGPCWTSVRAPAAWPWTSPPPAST